jgi:hypothetical protein
VQRRTRAVFGLLIAALGLRVSGPLPFSQAELHEALALRVRAAVPVEVVAGPAGEAIVRVGDKERTVDLGDSHGPAAARRVALAVADLATDVDPLPAPAIRSAALPRDSTTRLALLAGPAAGSNLDGVRFQAALDGRLRLLRGLGLFASAGYSPGPDATIDGIAVSLRSVPLRLGLGWQAGAFELRVGAVATPYWLDGMMTSRSGVVAGGGLAALYAIDLAPNLDLVLAGGADAFANRDDFTIHGTSAVATSRVATWAALGLGWRPR